MGAQTSAPERALGMAGWAVVIAFATIVAVLVAMNCWLRFAYPEFYAVATPEFAIPDLGENFVPQSITYYDEGDQWVFSGHGMRQTPSAIVRRASDGSVATLHVKNPDGSLYWGHAAAVPCHGDYAYLTTKNGFLVFDSHEVATAADGSVVQAERSFDVGFTPAFMTVRNDVLYVGVFYQDVYYKTPASMHLKTPIGTVNPAVMYAYDLTSDDGFTEAHVPMRVYSIPGFVQGMCITDDGQMVLSCSWGKTTTSHLLYYDLSQIHDEAIYKVNGSWTPLAFLDERSLVRRLATAPLLEGIAYHDGRVWTSSEAASNEFWYGKFTGLGSVFAVS